MSSILITGASKGIGHASAAELARRGHRVVATARDLRTLDDLDVDRRLTLDVTDQASVEAAVQQAGAIDVLLSNAGVIFHAAVEASPPAELERLFALNTLGAIRVAQALLPGMRERRHGRLVFVSSAMGRTVLPGTAGYAASKWALEALGEALAIEVGHFGVDVCLVQPGPVSSGALDDMLAYQLPDDPYAALFAQSSDLSQVIRTPEQTAADIADVIERPQVPLRVPISDFSAQLLAARDEAPWDRPFVRMPLDW